MSGIDLYLSPAQDDPEPIQPVVGFRQHQSLTQLATQAHNKLKIQKAPDPATNNVA